MLSYSKGFFVDLDDLERTKILLRETYHPLHFVNRTINQMRRIIAGDAIHLFLPENCIFFQINNYIGSERLVAKSRIDLSTNPRRLEIGNRTEF